jgi:hypothetical protein
MDKGMILKDLYVVESIAAIFSYYENLQDDLKNELDMTALADVQKEKLQNIISMIDQ